MSDVSYRQCKLYHDAGKIYDEDDDEEVQEDVDAIVRNDDGSFSIDGSAELETVAQRLQATTTTTTCHVCTTTTVARHDSTTITTTTTTATYALQ